MRQISRGICRLCQRELSKPAMPRHLAVCRQTVGLQEDSMLRQPQKSSVFHLVVEGYRLPMYWLHLEVAAGATLETLDSFLRDIWLECCGHLSAFEIGGVRYCEDKGLFDIGGWSSRKQSMQVTLENVLSPGQVCTYEYDFGSTTELRLKVMAVYDVETRGQVIRILARNTLPSIPCDVCGKPVTSVCEQCVARERDTRYFCAACAETHECGKAMLVQLQRVNSPREGVCGYAGPTHPAYI